MMSTPEKHTGRAEPRSQPIARRRGPRTRRDFPAYGRRPRLQLCRRSIRKLPRPVDRFELDFRRVERRNPCGSPGSRRARSSPPPESMPHSALRDESPLPGLGSSRQSAQPTRLRSSISRGTALSRLSRRSQSIHLYRTMAVSQGPNGRARSYVCVLACTANSASCTEHRWHKGPVDGRAVLHRPGGEDRRLPNAGLRGRCTQRKSSAIIYSS
jgi:hypothetical protein